ncbi:MAG: hypothetical protein WC916_03195 [Candidatus Woesearchaeota archaeon]
MCTQQRALLFVVGFIITVLVLSTSVFAVDKVISNSADWKDVYSVMLYASLIDKKPGLFLTSARHGTVLLYSIPKDSNGTLVMSSRSQPYVVNYKAVMDAQGYKNVEEVISNTINLELAKRINKEKNIKKFIIVDDAYGYNALSAASYAVIDKYFVVFANERNIGQIDTFLGDVSPEKVIIFGQVSEVVKTRLAKYNPETINTGDRFENNIEMVKRYQKIKESKQTVMSNGEFIESSIMSGDDPVLFIGKNTVPTQVQEYIKSSGFQVAVLVGNELINSATAIRRQLGISVFVKFAQGARTPTGTIATVEDLDKFPMPSYTINLEIYSMMYNKATNALWITYRNNAAIGTYLKGTITLNANNNKVVIGDQEPIFIDKNQYKTISYDLAIEGDNITAAAYTLFGEGKKSLENVLEKSMTVEGVDILDDAIVNMTNIVYDQSNSRFIITVRNIGTVDSYVGIELIDLYMNGEYKTVASEKTILLKPGKEGELFIDAKLSDADIQNNPIIKVKGYYGERENSLIKTIFGEYAFQLKGLDLIYYILIIVIILLLFLIFNKKKCKHCGRKNLRWKKKCTKCNESLYGKTRKERFNHHHHNEHHTVKEETQTAPVTEEKKE